MLVLPGAETINTYKIFGTVFGSLFGSKFGFENACAAASSIFIRNILKLATGRNNAISSISPNDNNRKQLRGDSRMPKVLKASALKTKAIENPVSAPAKVADVVKLNPLKSATIQKSVSETETRPKNPSANVLPTEGYVLEIDGKFKSQYETSGEASKAGLELKTKYPQIQVKIYDAKARTRTPVELSA